MATVYISTGSNMGGRFDYLQSGLHDVSERIGEIVLISSVVETPALGFDGSPFLNACFTVETSLLPDQVMEQLLQIEKKHGRERDASKGYVNRTLDLDLLFYDDSILNTPFLTLPHPSLEKRRFVVQPLAEIVPNKKHPALSQTVAALLQDCPDNTSIQVFDQKLIHPRYRKIKEHAFVCVEGIIGCGKTTLAKVLADTLGYKTLEERFAENPFLPKFYRKPKRFAFPLELSFLADRFKQINEEAEQLDLFQSGVVADYHMSKSLVFAKNTLNEDEYPLFKQLYELMSRSANQPSLCIYLRQTPERAKANIKNRGRSYEQNIAINYLEQLAKGYDQHLPFLKAQMAVAVVDVSDLDFVLQQQDLYTLLDRINVQLDAIA